MNSAITNRKLPRSAKHRLEEGQAMVEFALVITFVFLLFVSIFQMILFMYAYNTLADAAKEGVRYAIVHGTGLCGTLASCACSGPGTGTSVIPAVGCSDTAGANVVTAVVGGSGCSPTCGLASLSFQSISTTNNQCGTATANSVNVCYNPGNANSSNTTFGSACSQPGCLVRVTVSHTYTPLFGLGWPSFTMSTAANGRIMN